MSVVVVDAIIDVKACSFFVIFQSEVDVTRTARSRFFIKSSQFLYY